MSEKIRENFEGPSVNREQKEPIEILEKNNEVISTQKKEELLQNIYKKEVKKDINENINLNQGKTVSGLVKEFFSVGTDKTVAKLRRLFSKGDIDASEVDNFHDEITDKNKGKN